MKAAIYQHPGAPSLLQLGEVPDPIPADGELLVRVEANSIEGGDLVGRREAVPSGPGDVPGYAAAGEILKTCS